MWNKICDVTLQSMAEHIEPFLSPIWKFDNEDNIQSHGTGSYIECGSKKFIITNEHVAKYHFDNGLTHSFHKSENILVFTNRFFSKNAPIDVAINEIENSIWEKEVCEAKAISLSRFDDKHQTVKGELLFFAGYSGQRSAVVFGNMQSRGTPFLTQECPLPESIVEANPEYHLSIPYPPDLARTADPSVPLPYPHGFSGSLLWNTTRLECLQKNIEWHPSMAKVTGIIWGWSSSLACILATKVECLQLNEMIELYDSKGLEGC